jgi:hypothetical protein
VPDANDRAEALPLFVAHRKPESLKDLKLAAESTGDVAEARDENHSVFVP